MEGSTEASSTIATIRAHRTGPRLISLSLHLPDAVSIPKTHRTVHLRAVISTFDHKIKPLSALALVASKISARHQKNLKEITNETRKGVRYNGHPQ